MKLTQGMYSDINCKMFGIKYGQQSLNDVVRNAGWFNHLGEKLGMGDLSILDLDNIASDIPNDETFIILDESTSSWDMPKDLNRFNPGIDYLMQNAVWIVSGFTATKYEVYKVVDYVTKNGVVNYKDAYLGMVQHNIPYTEITRDRLFSTLGYQGGQFYHVPKTINTVIRKDSYYGLDVYEFSTGAVWAVGNADAACKAAERKLKDSLHDTNFDLLINYLPFYSEDIKILKQMSDKYGDELSHIIKVMLGENLNAYVEHQLARKGCGVVLASYDSIELYSMDVPGLPQAPELFAYRVD